MRRRLCCAYNVSRGRANIGRIQALQAVACRGRVSPTSDINRRLMVSMTTIGIFWIYDIICRIGVSHLAFLEVWMWFIFQLNCLILSRFMRVFGFSSRFSVLQDMILQLAISKIVEGSVNFTLDLS